MEGSLNQDKGLEGIATVQGHLHVGFLRLGLIFFRMP